MNSEQKLQQLRQALLDLGTSNKKVDRDTASRIEKSMGCSLDEILAAIDDEQMAAKLVRQIPQDIEQQSRALAQKAFDEWFNFSRSIAITMMVLCLFAVIKSDQGLWRVAAGGAATSSLIAVVGKASSKA